MNALCSPLANANLHPFQLTKLSKTLALGPPLRVNVATVVFQSIKSVRAVSSRIRALSGSKSQSNVEEDDDDEGQALVEDLRVPEHWMVPSKAKEESEWLRVTLHKWLDDEYCPEETNIEISKVAAQSFYNSLIEKDADIGVILLKMAKDLQSISYQESFHGAFSSANAAIDLVMRRIEQVSSPS